MFAMLRRCWGFIRLRRLAVTCSGNAKPTCSRGYHCLGLQQRFRTRHYRMDAGSVEGLMMQRRHRAFTQ